MMKILGQFVNMVINSTTPQNLIFNATNEHYDGFFLGESCYQKNTYHLNKFRHPHREIPKTIKDSAKKLNNFEFEVHSTCNNYSHSVIFINKSCMTKMEQKRECLNNEEEEVKKQNKNVTSVVEPDDTADTPSATSSIAEDEHENELLPPSPTNVKEKIKQKYLTEMPEDFYLFWEFCQFINQEKPCGILYHLYLSN